MCELSFAADEWEETAWLQAAVHNAAFAYLADVEEDIYTLRDGRPVQDEDSKGEAYAGSAGVCERRDR